MSVHVDCILYIYFLFFLFCLLFSAHVANADYDMLDIAMELALFTPMKPTVTLDYSLDLLNIAQVTVHFAQRYEECSAVYKTLCHCAIMW